MTHGSPRGCRRRFRPRRKSLGGRLEWLVSSLSRENKRRASRCWHHNRNSIHSHTQTRLRHFSAALIRCGDGFSNIPTTTTARRRRLANSTGCDLSTFFRRRKRKRETIRVHRRRLCPDASSSSRRIGPHFRRSFCFRWRTPERQLDTTRRQPLAEFHTHHSLQLSGSDIPRLFIRTSSADVGGGRERRGNGGRRRRNSVQWSSFLRPCGHTDGTFPPFFFKMKRRLGGGDTFWHRLNNEAAAAAATTTTSVAVDGSRLKTWSTSCRPCR